LFDTLNKINTTKNEILEIVKNHRLKNSKISSKLNTHFYGIKSFLFYFLEM